MHNRQCLRYTYFVKYHFFRWLTLQCIGEEEKFFCWFKEKKESTSTALSHSFQDPSSSNFWVSAPTWRSSFKSVFRVWPRVSAPRIVRSLCANYTSAPLNQLHRKLWEMNQTKIISHNQCETQISSVAKKQRELQCEVWSFNPVNISETVSSVDLISLELWWNSI